MPSETEICNLALSHLGEQPITSLAEDSPSARACQLHYSVTRDEVLRAGRWNFAAARAVLTRNAQAPAFEWLYSYALPADCIRVMDLNALDKNGDRSEDYTIEGRNMLTDEATAKVTYIRRIQDASLFDPLFVDALALKLAVALSELIRGTTQKTGELMAQYERAVALARRVDANEGRRHKGVRRQAGDFSARY